MSKEVCRDCGEELGRTDKQADRKRCSCRKLNNHSKNRFQSLLLSSSATTNHSLSIFGGHASYTELEELEAGLAREESLTARHGMKVKLVIGNTYILSTWLTAKGLFDAAVESGSASPEGMITAAMAATVSSVVLAASVFLFLGLVQEGED